MTLKQAFEREWAPPYRSETADPGVLVGQLTTEVISAVGHWTNCDVYIDAPASWFNAVEALDVFFSLYCIERGEYIYQAVTDGTRVVWSPNPAINPTTSGRFSARIFQLRGHPCDGFQLRATPNAGSPAESANFRIECWGEESGDAPQTLGQRFMPLPGAVGAGPFTGGMSTQFANVPYRDSRTMGLAPSGTWYGVHVDPTTGNLQIDVVSIPAAAGPLATAPSQQSGVLVAATPLTLAAAPVVNRITISSDLGNAAGSIIAFGYSATPVAGQLGPGDSVDLFVTSPALVTLLTASVGLVYHVSVN